MCNLLGIFLNIANGHQSKKNWNLFIFVVVDVTVVEVLHFVLIYSESSSKHLVFTQITCSHNTNYNSNWQLYVRVIYIDKSWRVVEIVKFNRLSKVTLSGFGDTLHTHKVIKATNNNNKQVNFIAATELNTPCYWNLMT